MGNDCPNHGLLGTSLTRRPRGRAFSPEREMMKPRQIMFAAGLLLSACISAARAQTTNPSMPIIILSPGEASQRLLRLPTPPRAFRS